MTNINSDVLTAGVLTAEPWRARLGAFCPRSTFPGTSVPGAGGGTGPAVVVQSVPRVRVKAVPAFPIPQSAFAAQVGQLNNYNHMTSVYAVGEGASGPPPYREPV
ncbi:MAG: hypothetical protein ACRDOA_16360 [Streptosporangiaceae bacterium]